MPPVTQSREERIPQHGGGGVYDNDRHSFPLLESSFQDISPNLTEITIRIDK